MQIENQMLNELFQEGSTTISNLLLTNYKGLEMDDKEMMLIIHLLYFQGKGDRFPVITELEKRMSATAEEIMRLLQRLVRQNYIQIDEMKDEQSGILYETYNLEPLYRKLTNYIVRKYQNQQNQQRNVEQEIEMKNIFVIFEQEFGRPLSPMEIEMINTWLDQDRHTVELIRYALKEAVFSNKLNFRYIDKILFEWQRKNLKSIDQIRSHVQKFRESTQKKSNSKESEGTLPEFEFYNWLDEK